MIGDPWITDGIFPWLSV